MRISDWSSDVCSSDLFKLEALGLLDRDHAFLADLFHRLGDLFADDGVAIGRDDADLGDLVRTGDGLGTRLQVLDDLGDGQIDAALQVHRVHAGGNRLHAFADNRLRSEEHTSELQSLMRTSYASY